MSTIPTPSARASASARARRRSPGSANRAPYRNEVKTRLDDETYEVMVLWQHLDGAESISAYIAGILRRHFLGLRAMLPAEISGVCAEASQSGLNQ
jgi:hypothetical protein